MVRVEPDSSWNNPPTDAQIRSIFRAAWILNIDLTEADMPANRLEARTLQYNLWQDVKAKNKKRR